VLPAAWGTDVVLASDDDVAELDIDDGEISLAIGSETAVWLRQPATAP
jgi:hypothetical protein